MSKTNAEYEKEKKEEQEKLEKSIGLLTYLGKSNIESQSKLGYNALGKLLKFTEVFRI